MTRLLRAWWAGLRVAFAPPGAVRVERSIVFALAGIVLAVGIPWLQRRELTWLIATLVLGVVVAIGAVFAPIARGSLPEREPPG